MNHYPAIDVQVSISRLMNDLIDRAHHDLAAKLRSILAVYAKAEDIISIGAYVSGSNPKIDEAVRKIDAIRGFLQQDLKVRENMESTLKQLRKVLE